MNRFELVRMVLDNLGIDQRRFSVEWVSAAEGIRFVQLITAFDKRIADLGPCGEKEGIQPETFQNKLKSAVKALEGRMLRMTFARQAKQIVDGKTYGQFPSREKLMETFVREKTMYETLCYLEEKERPPAELAGLLGIPEEQVMTIMETIRKKNIWK